MNGNDEASGVKNQPGNGASKQKPPKGGGRLPEHASPVFKFGLVVGFALLLLGGLPMMFAPSNWIVETFIICTGLSIILGAFGANAKIGFMGESGVLLGVAAIAVAVFVILIDQMSDRYVHIKLSGDVKEAQVKSVELVGDHQYPGGMLRAQDSWDFFIFGKEIKSPTINLRIVFLGGDDLEADFGCIDSNNIVPFLASGQTLHWNYSKKGNRLVDVKSKNVVGKIGCEDEAAFAQVLPAKSGGFSFGFISAAFADDRGVEAEGLADLILQLDSESTYLRRAARDQLGAKGEVAIKPLLQSFSKDGSSYRTQLGALVALNKIAMKKEVSIDQLKSELTPADIENLVQAANHSDKTMRVYASEFLYRLADARIIDPALKSIPSSSKDGKYNLLLVVSGSLSSANEDQKKEVSSKVVEFKEAGADKTNGLIDRVVSEAAK
jgi:hypothetical protein